MHWISVKDRLPQDKVGFLGTDGDVIFAAYWCKDNEKYKIGGWENCCYCGGSSFVVFSEKKNYYDKIVTHWMPLPNISDID